VLADAIVRAILRPNRISVYHLDQVEATIRLEMQTLFELLEVQRKSPESMAVVGHGPNGLLVKAVAFAYDLSCVSLEGPRSPGARWKLPFFSRKSEN
jgi:hypothetical protein